MRSARPHRWVRAGEPRRGPSWQGGLGLLPRRTEARRVKYGRQNPHRNAQAILRQADFKAIAFPFNAPFV